MEMGIAILYADERERELATRFQDEELNSRESSRERRPKSSTTIGPVCSKRLVS